MNTQFRTICDEETMRLTFPGETLYTCADCRKRVCLFSDLDATADNGSDFVCPQCQQARQDAARRVDHTTVSAFCHCPACHAARTPEGADRIASFNHWAIAINTPGATRRIAPQSAGRRWWMRQ